MQNTLGGEALSSPEATGFIPVNLPTEKFLTEFLARKARADTLVIDPPRDGMHPSALPSIMAFGSHEIIYVSCNPSTLVRDLGPLLGARSYDAPPETPTPLPLYRLTDIIPVDMFPHTHHIETVVRLERI